MSIKEGLRAFKIEGVDAPNYQMMGTLWRVLASGDQTGGIVGALDERSVQGSKVPMHVHDDADEIFYVLDGDFTFFIAEKRIEAAPGAFVYLPRFVHHGFQTNSREARIFNFLTPAGFERLILDMGKPAHSDDAPIPSDPNASYGQMLPEAVAKKYGMRIFATAGSK